MIILVDRNKDNDEAKENIIKAYKKLFGKDLEIGYESTGKPTCNQGYISISHTEGIYIAAISEENVGIDVERKDRKISSRLGTIKEWTYREAYGKFLGVGINKEILDSTIPLDLIGQLKIADEYIVSICSPDKIYVVYDVI